MPSMEAFRPIFQNWSGLQITRYKTTCTQEYSTFCSTVPVLRPCTLLLRLQIRFLCPRPFMCCSHSCNPLSILSPQACQKGRSSGNRICIGKFDIAAAPLCQCIKSSTFCVTNPTLSNLMQNKFWHPSVNFQLNFN